MVGRLNGDPSVDFAKSADALEELARGIKAHQKGLATRTPPSQIAPQAPEEIWVSQFGYRAIGGDPARDDVRRLALEARAPVSYRPVHMPDLAGLTPVIPQMEPVAIKPAVAPAPGLAPGLAPRSELLAPRSELPAPRSEPMQTAAAQLRAEMASQPMRAEPARRGMLSRLFGRG